MAQVGQKRPVQDSDTGGATESSREDSPMVSLPKRPATGSSFSFRPSPLQPAAKGFSLRQSSLQSVVPETKPLTPPTTRDTTEITTSAKKSAFLKLDQDELRVSSFSIMSGAPVMTTAGGSSTAPTSVTASRAPFTNPEKTPTSFDSPSESHSENYFAVATSNNGIQTDSPASNTFSDNNSIPSASDNEVELPVFGARAKNCLPEVHAFTGEESEKNIVVVSARLYIFEGDTRTWKERGRGEIRLNDSAKDEGVFQSRLVMRSSGTYRVLLNTHLWAQMSCDKANQKSIRVTAQHVSSTEEIRVYLITGATKDMQQLFTAIDRRIQALKRNATSETPASTDTAAAKQDSADEEDDKDECLSRQSSPDSSPEAVRLRQVDRAPLVVDTNTVKGDDNSSTSAADNSDSPPSKHTS